MEGAPPDRESSVAAKKKRTSRRKSSGRRGGWGFIAGLAGVLIVALVALQVVTQAPETEEAGPAPSRPAEQAAKPQPKPERPTASRPETTAPREAAPARPAAEPAARPAPVVAVTPQPVDRLPGVPKVSIVIDDCGYDLDLMKRFSRLRVPITFAVIPYLRHSEDSARVAWKAGKEVILHQPMEPEGYPDADPGQGALFRGMKQAEVARIVRENLESIPHVSGLNNHMGSAATADARLMALVMGEVARWRERNPGAYFLDSRTSADTVAYDTARRNGLPTAMRSVFLDHDESLDAVRDKLDELLATAESEGEAIGIGHVKPNTLTALEAMVASVGAGEFDFVFASELAR